MIVQRRLRRRRRRDLASRSKIAARRAAGAGVAVDASTRAGGATDRRLAPAGRRRPARRTSPGSTSRRPASSIAPRASTVDARLRTTNRNVFAIGDVAGGYQFTHIAGYHAGIVIRNALFRLPAKVDYRALPWVTYHRSRARPCRPDRGGGAEAQATTSRVLRWPFHENDRAQAERETEGLVKVLIATKAAASSGPSSSARRRAS